MPIIVWTTEDYTLLAQQPGWECEHCGDYSDNVPKYRCEIPRANGNYLCENCYQTLPHAEKGD